MDVIYDKTIYTVENKKDVTFIRILKLYGYFITVWFSPETDMTGKKVEELMTKDQNLVK